MDESAPVQRALYLDLWGRASGVRGLRIGIAHADHRPTRPNHLRAGAGANRGRLSHDTAYGCEWLAAKNEQAVAHQALSGALAYPAADSIPGCA
jgi:hypothetical protein